MRLKPEDRAELRVLLRMQRLLADERLCARYHINRRTLSRERIEMLDETSQHGTQNLALAWFNRILSAQEHE